MRVHVKCAFADFVAVAGDVKNRIAADAMQPVSFFDKARAACAADDGRAVLIGECGVEDVYRVMRHLRNRLREKRAQLAVRQRAEALMRAARDS